jgi:hypothetical protein
VAGLAAIGTVSFAAHGIEPHPPRYASAAATTLWIDLALVEAMAALTVLLPRPAARSSTASGSA